MPCDDHDDFRALVDFEPKPAGEREVIFETGAGTVGFSFVYEAPSTLVLRAAGSGGFVLATAKFRLTPGISPRPACASRG